MQVFRTGPLYTTTVFDKDAGGKLKAVHSRHEYFAVPLRGRHVEPGAGRRRVRGREVNRIDELTK